MKNLCLVTEGFFDFLLGCSLGDAQNIVWVCYGMSFHSVLFVIYQTAHKKQAPILRLHLEGRCVICIGMFENMDNLEVHGEQWLREEQKLKAEVVEISKAIALLFEDANFTLMRLFKLESPVQTALTTENRKTVLKQIGILLSKLRINAEELIKVDKRHEALKLKVIKFYRLPPDMLPNDHLQGAITVKEINEVLQRWTEVCKEINSGEEWKDAE